MTNVQFILQTVIGSELRQTENYGKRIATSNKKTTRTSFTPMYLAGHTDRHTVDGNGLTVWKEMLKLSLSWIRG